MAFSYGPRAGGDGSGGGSSRVGFVNALQGKTAGDDLNITNHASTFTDGNVVTPAWEISLRDSGRASLLFGLTVVNGFNQSSNGTAEYEVKLQMAAADTESATGTWETLTFLNASGVVYAETEEFEGETSLTHHINGEIPFDLDALPASATNGKYLKFRYQVRVRTAASNGSPIITIRGKEGYIALKAFGVGASSTDVGPAELGITENASEEGKAVVVNSTGDGFDLSATVVADDAITRAKIAANAVGTDEVQDGTITRAKIQDDAIDGSKIADDSIGNEHIAANAVQGAQIASGAITGGKIANNAITPTQVAGVTASGNSGQVVAINSSEDGFELITPSSGGGGVPANDSITNAMLKDNIITNAKMADDSVGANELIANSVTGDAINTGAVDTNQIADDAITPAKVDIQGSSSAGQVLALDTTNGTTFITRAYNTGGGGASTFADITGINPTTKGGTGFNASDISDLRNKLGIQSSTSDAVIPYSTNLATQKDGTMERVNSSTETIPTGLADGIAIRINNDQWALDLESGKQWKRTLTDTQGTWGTSTDVNLTNISTIAQLNAIPVGGARVMTTGNFRPQYPDDTYADKVIVGRHGEHDDDHGDDLIAMDRHNFWWAERPAADDTSITWHWEGTSIIPPGLYYTGGETDEEHIPVGSVAVLGGKTGIDGEEYINVMVGHSYNSSLQQSTYTGYWIDDDASKTIKGTTNTRGYVQGTWSRIMTDVDGIANTIISTDTFSGDPVFHGIVPAINSITFEDYTFKTSGNVTAGDILWNSSQRLVRVVAKTSDHHLPDLFNQDFEVEIRKDASNYIRGIFTSAAGPAGVVQAVFRADDLEIVGTINQNDEVDIKGHKAFVSKTETIEPIFLGLSEGSSEGHKIVRMNSAGTLFETTSTINASNIPDDAITPAKINGVDAPNGSAGQVLALNTAKDGFDLVSNSGGGGGGASAITDLTSIYTSSASTYTVVSGSISASSLTAGQTHYIQGTGIGNISIRFTSSDSGVNDSLTNGSIITFWVSNTAYRQLRITGNTASGNSRVIVGTITGGAGTIAVGNTVRILYNNTTAYDGVVKVRPDGKFGTGPVSVPSLGISGSAADTGDVITVGTNGTFNATGAYLFPTSVKPTISKSRSYQVITSGTPIDGQFRMNTGNIPTFGDTTGSANATFMASLDSTARAGDGTTILIAKDASNYISFRSTAAVTQGSNLSIFSSTSNVSTVGTLASGDDVQVFLEPANANQIIQFDAIGENPTLVDLPSGGGSSGVIKQTLLMRQEHGGDSRELSVSSTSTRAIIGGTGASSQQTGAWTLANKSTDWIRFSGGGLCYFGSIPAQPIIADFAVWYRWRDASLNESFQSWLITNSRVDEVPLGSDKLMIVKLFAGGAIRINNATVPTASNYTSLSSIETSATHVDCAVGSGNKFVKLSELNSNLTDGMEVQFTLAFMRQSAGSGQESYSSYTARRFFLTCDVMDGGNVQANY